MTVNFIYINSSVSLFSGGVGDVRHIGSVKYRTTIPKSNINIEI